jgi:energy-coupling factor transporter transmembrane protein EcfT
MYGLANLLLLALSLNELKLKDFVFDNPLTFLLAFFSFVFTIAVVYFPAILLYKMARVIDKEKKLGLESQLSFIKWMGGALIISMTFFQMTHPFVLDLVVSIYVVFHYVIIGYLARKWLNHPILLAENISKEVLEEK